MPAGQAETASPEPVMELVFSIEQPDVPGRGTAAEELQLEEVAL